MITIEQVKNLTKDEVMRLADSGAFEEALNIQALRQAKQVVRELESEILPLAEALSRHAESVGLKPTSEWDDMEDEDGNEPDQETQTIRGDLYDNFDNLASLADCRYGEDYDSGYGEHEFWIPSTC